MRIGTSTSRERCLPVRRISHRARRNNRSDDQGARQYQVATVTNKASMQIHVLFTPLLKFHLASYGCTQLLLLHEILGRNQVEYPLLVVFLAG